MRAWMLVGLVACLALGCSSRDPESLDNLSENERAELPVLDHEGVRELIAMHEGRIVVLAGWSARGDDYAAFYEGLAELAKPQAEAGEDAEGEAGPAVIAMNLDGAVAVRDKVLPLIRKVEPPFSNCVFHGDQMMLTAVVDRDWGGSFPAIWIYDRTGEFRAGFYGADALDEAKARLAQMAEKKPGRGRRSG